MHTVGRESINYNERNNYRYKIKKINRVTYEYDLTTITGKVISYEINMLYKNGKKNYKSIRTKSSGMHKKTLNSKLYSLLRRVNRGFRLRNFQSYDSYTSNRLENTIVTYLIQKYLFKNTLI